MKNVNTFHRVQKRKPPKPTVTVDNTTMDFWRKDIEYSKVAYARLVRVNRYLNCMKENSDIEDCSICMTSIVKVNFMNVKMAGADPIKCTLLIYHFHAVRFVRMRSSMLCFVLRTAPSEHLPSIWVSVLSSSSISTHVSRSSKTQFSFLTVPTISNSARHFTVDTSEKCTDSSIKIEQIVREVHKLKHSDPNVKILLFSQWADVLNTLKNELLSNEIASRTIVNTRDSMQKMVEEFKVTWAIELVRKQQWKRVMTITGSPEEHNMPVNAI